MSAAAAATIVVKAGEPEFSGNMPVERAHASAPSHGCVVTGSCSGTLPITLTLHDNGVVTARTSFPLEPLAQINCTPPQLVCEVKVTELTDCNGTHDGQGNFTFCFWRLQPDNPESGRFKVAGT